MAPFVPERHLPRRILLVVAAPEEVRAVVKGAGGDPAGSRRPWKPAPLGSWFDLVETGIGKANAAGATAVAADPERHSAILNIGIAGSYPGSHLALKSVVLGLASVFADEGVQTPDKFIPCHKMGFPIGDFEGAEVPAAGDVGGWLSNALHTLRPVGGLIATVSTCSGTNVLAERFRSSTQAICECMEGAAVGLVAQRLGIPFMEVRVISNTTGDRTSQIWDLPGALEMLTRVIGLLSKSGSP